MNSNLLIAELDHEVVSTKKLLERLPEEKLSWKPHEQAMTLGQLALHIATNPGNIASFALAGKTTVEELVDHPLSTEKSDILDRFEKSVEKAKQILTNANGDWDTEAWHLTKDDASIFSLPRPLLCRLLMFNHWYHHRGQLAAYLRILGVALPSIYGPSADENPFA